MMIRHLLVYLFVIHVNLIVTHQETELKNAPPDHEIPFSEHEDPPEPSTKPKYVAPGEWAKPPADKDIPLDFIPTRLYAQVRKTDTVKRVPRQEALSDAKTDEEKENAGRLKEVVSKRKVNTVYTEEGYEDAAYDHGGHEREADFKESYEAGDNIENIHASSEVDPQTIAENEISKLERDLSREDKEAAKGAETEVPENLKNLKDSSSEDYDDSAGTTDRDLDYDDGASPNSAEAAESKSEQVTTSKKPQVFPTFINPEQLNTSYPTIIPGSNIVTTLKQLSSSEEPTAVDYGKTFWEFYKTQKPPTTSTEDSQSYPEHRRVDVSSEYPLPPLPESPELPGHHESSEAPDYPLSRIYETWKQQSNENTYRVTSPEHDIPESGEVPGSMESTPPIDERTVREKRKKPYTSIIIRAPVQPCNNSQDSNSNYTFHGVLDSNEESEVINNHLAVNNSNIIQPPGPLGQVTYSNFLPPTKLPSVTHESRSTQEINSETAVGPLTSPQYRYHPQQRHRHRPSANRNSPSLVRLITMLPPLPASRSEYAQYQRRNGNAQPQQHDLWPGVFRSYRPAFRFDGMRTGNSKKLLNIDKRRSNEKVPVNGVKTVLRRLVREFGTRRKKRSVDNLLDDAPGVVQDVIDKEIQMRFPEESSENESDENEQFKIYVPEFDFSEVINSDEHTEEPAKPREIPNIDLKYPFYNNNEISESSALKYAVNPLQVPKKTLGGTEFYDSRDRYMNCDDIDPDLTQVVPEEEEPVPNRGPNEDLPRLRGLGDQLKCMRDKYFDENPLDNPLFSEQIAVIDIPREFSILNLKSRVSNYESDPEASNIMRRMSRRPENSRPRAIRSNQIRDREQAVKDNTWNNHAKRYRKRLRTTTVAPNDTYEKEVYNDVMGTIKNMANMFESVPLTVKPTERAPTTTPRPRAVKAHHNHPVKPLRIHNQHDQAGYMTNKSPPKSLPPHPTPISWRYKLVPYRTSRVSYRMRPRTESPNSVGYFKTVRVHKRSIDLPLSEPAPAESQTSAAITYKRRRRPSSTSAPETSSQASEKVVYTIRDLVRHSKPRGSIRFGNFPIATAAASEVDVRRNEPRYTPIRKVDEDIYSSEDKNEDAGRRDDGELAEEYVEPKKENHQYRVHESMEEEPTREKEHPEYEEEEETNDDSGERPSKTYSYNSQNEEDESSENDRGKGHEQQVEKPETYVDSNEEDESSEKSENPEYAESETEEPDAEREFDSFVSGMFSKPSKGSKFSGFSSSSPSESFDTTFGSMKFSTPWKSPSSSMKFSKPWKQSSSNYFKNFDSPFSWNREDEDVSEESRIHEKRSGPREFPWKRRQRSSKKRRVRPVKDDESDEEGESESNTKLWKLFPWEKYEAPSKNFGTSKVITYLWPDTERFGNRARPIKFNSEYETPSIYTTEKKSNKNHRKSTHSADVTTTSSRQIPAPTASSSTLKTRPTAPTYRTTSLDPVHTIRTRPTKITTSDSKPTNEAIVTNGTSKPTDHSQPLELLKTHPSTAKSNSDYRRKLRMTSSTIRPDSDRRNYHDADDKSTTPSTRKVERRSKVSKEEIITSMSFPEADSIEAEHISRERKLPGRKEMVRKVSIVTKETPEHIYRTEEVDRDGVKGMYVSIIPNNHTSSQLTSEEMLAKDRIDEKNFSNGAGSERLDIILPVPDDAVALSQRGTRKVISSVSWTSENYDY